MNIFLQCISCCKRSPVDEASTPLVVRQPYLRTQSLDRSFRRRRFRSSATSVEWHPSLTTIAEDSSDCSSRGDRTPLQQQHKKRFDARSEKMMRIQTGKSRVRSGSIDCRCDSFAAIFSASAAAPFML